MCYNCVIIELYVKSNLISNKIEPFLLDRFLTSYPKKCFNNNKFKIFNYIIYYLDLNIKQKFNLDILINNIIENPFKKKF